MTYRNVSTAIWADDTILSMSPEQKLLFLYLHTSPYTSACGIFKMHPKTMAFQMGLIHTPFESALKGLCAAFPDFVAVDWQTTEVALLQYPKQLLITANNKALAIVEKEILKVESQYLLRELIARNSATLSRGYLAQLRRLQMAKINTEDVNIMLHGDLHNSTDNQQVNREIEIEIESNIDIVVFDENDHAEKKPKTLLPFAEIIAHLNSALGKAEGKGFRSGTRSTKALITARWNEGFRLDDFKAVIDDRVQRWAADPHMAEYLRPNTLFGTKFESYLQAAQSPPTHANTDDALNDIELAPEAATTFQSYIKYVLNNYLPLFQSNCRVFSASEYLDYLNNTSLPGVPTYLTPSEKRNLQLRLHSRLSSDKYFREKYRTVWDAYRAAVRAIANHEKPLV